MNTKKKILIVDDEPVSLEFFDLMLSKLGFTVIKAFDGEEALGKVKKVSPDIILMDNIMPRMTGFELTKILKSDPKYKDIPIIMLSALDDVKDKVEGFELGIDDYITKPFNFYEVLARIRATLRNREICTQIALRESRLSLAEELSVDMKRELNDFAKTIDELDNTINEITSGNPQIPGSISEKSKKIREHVAELDARIEKTKTEWDHLKKNEIDLPVLEIEMRKKIGQEQAIND